MNSTKIQKIDELEIAYLNIRSLVRKVGKFQMELKKIEKVPHVIIVAETWLKPNTESKVNFENYNSVFCSRPITIHGGIGIFIHDSIEYEIVIRQHVGINHIVLIKLLNLNKNLLAFYRTPDKYNKPDVFWSELEKLLPSLENAIIFCDSNMNLLKMNKKNRKFMEMFTSNGFRICNKIADEFDAYTCKTERLGKVRYSIIDQIISNLNTSVNVENFDIDFSDHRLLYTTAKLNNE